MKDETEFESLRRTLKIEGASKRKIEIVDELEAYNKKAILFMQYQIRQRISFKNAYRKLQRTNIWKEARKLLKEYYGENLICNVCKKKIEGKFVLHHLVYNRTNIFTPLYINMIHPYCHNKELRDII